MEISIRNLNKVYRGGKPALLNISLEIKPPSFIGLLGQNGAGKSTLMKLLTLNLLPTSGEILLDGEPLLKKEKRFKAALGYLPQEYGLFEDLTVYQFLDYMASMKKLTNEAESRIDYIIVECGLSDYRKMRIETLSGGYKQRVGIAQALLGSPEMIILDEPTVGLDPEERLNFRNYFSRIAADKIVLLSTHITEDVRYACNQLIVLHHGRVLYTGATESLIADTQGHVGTFFSEKGMDPIKIQAPGIHVTSRITSSDGIYYRIIAETLPDSVQKTEPTLEDAYIYITTQEAVS